ncbi:MAG: hypothetical protein J7484_06570 [Microbacterium sp.]|nr:hypothetical protein [Microbacterium sp.]
MKNLRTRLAAIGAATAIVGASVLAAVPAQAATNHSWGYSSQNKARCLVTSAVQQGAIVNSGGTITRMSTCVKVFDRFGTWYTTNIYWVQ